MSETPKPESTNFEFVDRRKLKAQEERSAESVLEQKLPEEKPPEQKSPEQKSAPAAPASAEPKPGPRLVVDSKSAEPEAAAQSHEEQEPDLPPPTAQESQEQKAAYDASAQRIEEMARAQNPGMGAQAPIGFEQLVQQFYVSGLIQMGAGTQQGQRPQIDILGARGTIDMMGVLAEKTKGNLTPAEDRMLQTVLYELRMMFLEITGMISMPNVQPPPPAKR